MVQGPLYPTSQQPQLSSSAPTHPPPSSSPMQPVLPPPPGFLNSWKKVLNATIYQLSAFLGILHPRNVAQGVSDALKAAWINLNMRESRAEQSLAAMSKHWKDEMLGYHNTVTTGKSACRKQLSWTTLWRCQVPWTQKLCQTLWTLNSSSSRHISFIDSNKGRFSA